jgi:hypothetical protein
MDNIKIVAIFFILLMVGSSIGAMVVSILGPKDEGLQIPSERILKYRLTDQQKAELIKRGFTIVEYEYPETCFECEQQKSTLESWTAQSDNQIFLQEMSSPVSTTTVSVMSFRGSQTLTDPTDDEVSALLCDMMAQKTFWCVDL